MQCQSSYQNVCPYPLPCLLSSIRTSILSSEASLMGANDILDIISSSWDQMVKYKDPTNSSAL